MEVLDLINKLLQSITSLGLIVFTGVACWYLIKRSK